MTAPHISYFYTPLYDNERGGPPRAFRCEVGAWYCPGFHKHDGVQSCARVTRTEQGMMMHLRICHDIERQPRLFK